MYYTVRLECYDMLQHETPAPFPSLIGLFCQTCPRGDFSGTEYQTFKRESRIRYKHLALIACPSHHRQGREGCCSGSLRNHQPKSMTSVLIIFETFSDYLFIKGRIKSTGRPGAVLIFRGPVENLT